MLPLEATLASFSSAFSVSLLPILCKNPDEKEDLKLVLKFDSFDINFSYSVLPSISLSFSTFRLSMSIASLLFASINSLSAEISLPTHDKKLKNQLKKSGFASELINYF